MNMPFTVNQFLEVFAKYNLSIWPIQIIAYLLGSVTVLLTIKKTTYSDRVISGILSCLWIWNGAAYQISYFSRINPAAYLFGTLFIVQGILFFYSGVLKSKLSFGLKSDSFSVIGILIVFYAMVAYPIIGHLVGHGFPYSPVYGVAPCPTTIFTFGLLLWSEKKVPVYTLLIPIFWTIVGTFAAIHMGILEDFGLIVSGVISTSMALFLDRKGRASQDLMAFEFRLVKNALERNFLDEL